MNPDSQKFQNYSHASKLRQSLIPKEVRKQRARDAAKARWANKTPEEKFAHSRKMIEAKQFGKLKNEKL